MDSEAILRAVLAWLLAHAPDILERLHSELAPVDEILRDDSAATAKLAQIRAAKAAKG